MEVFHVYPRRRGDFGRQCLFSDRQAELLVDILPDPSLGLHFTEKTPRDRALQVGWHMSEHQVSYLFQSLFTFIHFYFTVTQGTEFSPSYYNLL